MPNQYTIEQLEELSPQELGMILLKECYKKYYHDIRYIKNLIAAGADVEYSNSDNITPLHMAARDGLVEVVKVLLEAQAPLEAQDFYGNTPLHCAARSDDHEVVMILLEAGASKEAEDHGGWKPWHTSLMAFQFPIEELKPDNYE